MRFLTIQANNFLSFKELDYVLPSTGLYFIGGRVIGSTMSISNGAGKSALFEALAWGLFGKTTRHTEKAEDREKVVNRYVKKNCSVEIILEDDDGDACIVRRYRNHSQWQNSLRLFKGDDELTGPSTDATQKSIDSILGMNWTVFSSAVVFGAQAKRFNDAADAKKREVFDEILMLHPYQIAQQEVKGDLKELRTSIEIMEGKLQTEIFACSEANIELVNANEALSKLNAEKKDAEEQIKLQEEILRTSNKELERVEKVKDVASVELLSLEKETERLYAYIEKIRKDEITEKEKIKSDASAVYNHQNLLAFQIEECQGWVDKKEMPPKGSRCPTCGTEVSSQSIEDVADHYKEEIKKMVPVKEKVDAMIEKIEKNMKEVALKWSKKMREAEQAHQEIVAEKNEQLAVIREVEKEINHNSTMITIATSEISHLKGGGKEREDLVMRMKGQAEKKVTERTESVKNLTDKIKADEDQTQYLKFWVDGFGGKGIKSLLLDEILPQLNTLADYYGSVLLDNEIRMEFDTEAELKSGEIRDKFDMNLIADGEKIGYRDCSQGEKGRIDSAVLLALQNLIFKRSNCASSLVIFDEVFEHLDSVGIERMVNLLKEESSEKAIFVISHQNEFSDYFDNVVIVEKEGKESRLVV